MSNRRIFKYPLVLAGSQIMPIPAGAQVLSVQMQAGQLTLWAIVDPAAPDEDLHLAVVGTGQEVPETYSVYLGTVQDGPYVWHVFARPR